MPKWSPQQLEAIETVNKNITVSASAGAGKTTVLVNRILKRMQTDHVQVNQILAMTFTSAAAMEMKKRLMKELQIRIEQTDDAFIKQQLQAQLTLLPTAAICTIDSFCLDVVKNYSYLLEEDPERFQNIFDENTLSFFRQQALEQALKKQYQLHDPHFIQLLETLSNSNDQHETLKKLIRSLAQEATKHEEPIPWLHSLSAYYQDFTSLDQLPKNVKNYFFHNLQEDLLFLVQQTEAFSSFVSMQTESDIFALYIQTLNAYYAQMKEALDQRNYMLFREYIETVHSTVKCPDCRKVLGKPLKDVPEYKDYRDQIHKFIEDLYVNKLYSEKSLLSSLCRQKEMTGILISCTIAYLDAFANIKKEQNGIDFEDMERYALYILQYNNGEIANLLRKQYVDILVDEYQDSNDLQESLIQAICRDDNVFRVGDIKQSIYSFRNAKPDLMRNIIHKQTKNDKVIYLSNNFRSKYHIVDFNNVIFTQLMNIPGFQDTYTQQDAVQTGVQSQKENDHFIDVDILCKKALQENSLLSANELKAEYIAQKIVQMREETEFNQWRDFVILTRTHAPKAILKKVFDKYQIPCHITTTTGFFQDEAIQAILSWLQLLENPNNEIALLTILTSPYYNVTDEQLSQWKLAKTGSYLAYLAEINHPLLVDYQYLKQNLSRYSVSDCINELYDLHDFYSQKTSETQKNNLDSLFELAIASTDKHESLADFMNVIKINQARDMGDATALSETADVVRVITVHGSKGLEFPVVFYWSSDLKRRLVQTTFTDDELGFAFDDIQLPQRFRKPTLIRSLIERKQLAGSLEEELRILYVALTRPKQKLVIVDLVNEPKQIPNHLSYQIILKNPQVSTLILSALKKNPLDYVHVHYIDRMWKPIHTRKTIETTTTSLPIYTLPLHELQRIRPSSLESHELSRLNLHGTSATKRGTQLHKAMELLDFHTYDPKNILPLEISSNDMIKIQKFFEHPIFQTIKDMEIHKEYPFVYQHEEQYIQGIIDCFCINDHSIVIIDYKSDRNVDAKTLIARYQMQVETYKEVMHKAYPKHMITCYIYSFELCDWISVDNENHE